MGSGRGVPLPDDTLLLKKKSKKRPSDEPEDGKKDKRCTPLDKDGATDDTQKKKKKKRKAPETAEEANDEHVKQSDSEPQKKKKKKRTEEQQVETAGPADPDQEDQALAQRSAKKPSSNSLSDFPLSQRTVNALASKNITSLFEIQAVAFPPVFAGNDLIARAKTGSGKTFAFVLPIIEQLVNSQAKANRRAPEPRVLVLAPTRELASQVARDFELLSGAHGLSSAVFYGGTPIGPQCGKLREGVDVLVSTPGRLIDHLQRETVSLKRVAHVVLDEADEMLSMGFQEDVEKILSAVTSPHQTLLFSATVPKWVKDITHKYLDPKKTVTVDTVGDESNRTNTDITHLAIPCPPQCRGDTLADLVKVHAGTFGKSIVFCDTKRDVNELADHAKLISMGVAILHGDIPQATREATMEKYRQGKVRCLVATDVAARGLDIQGVDLVVQTHPPTNYESYIHRAGRTGRAGRKGVCVTFYSLREAYLIQIIEHKAGIKLKRAGPPSPAQIVAAAAVDAAKVIESIHEDNVDAFREAAAKLTSELGAEEVVAAALACMTGYTTRIVPRSILTCFDDQVAILLSSTTRFESAGHAFSMVRRNFSAELAQGARGMTLCVDQTKAVFDVPEKFLKEIKEAEKRGLLNGLSVEVCRELPEMKENEMDISEANQRLKQQRSFQREKWQHGGGRGGSRGRGSFGRGGSFRGGHRGRGRS